jgi:hypothetical protein
MVVEIMTLLFQPARELKNRVKYHDNFLKYHKIIVIFQKFNNITKIPSHIQNVFNIEGIIHLNLKRYFLYKTWFL